MALGTFLPWLVICACRAELSSGFTPFICSRDGCSWKLLAHDDAA